MLEALIQNEKIIRIYTDQAPGNGNQAAALNLISYIKQTLKFEGLIEFIYPADIVNKIAALFNLENAIPPVLMLEDKNIVLINSKSHLERLNQTDFTAVKLGAAVTTAGPYHLIPKNHPLYRSELADNPAAFFNTDVFIEFNPYMQSAETTRIYFRDSDKKIHLDDSIFQYYVFPSSSYDEMKYELENSQEGQALLTAKPGLNSFLAAIDHEVANVMPVYGYTVRDLPEYHLSKVETISNSKEFSLNHFPKNALVQKTPFEELVIWKEPVFPGNILQIICAARYAQMNDATSATRPLIIPVFYPYVKEMQNLIRIIKEDSYDWHGYKDEEIKNMRALIKDLELKESFFAADISDIKTSSQIESLSPGDIMLLSMGSLPKQVFDAIYTFGASGKPNSWPPVREGATSLNSLLLTGKPHIRCLNQWEIGFDLIQDENLQKTFETLYPDTDPKTGICQGMLTWRTHPTLYKELGTFIIESQYPNSATNKYFQRLKEEASNPNNDRILSAFTKAFELLEAKKNVTEPVITYQHQESIRDTESLPDNKADDTQPSRAYSGQLELEGLFVLCIFMLSLMNKYLSHYLPSNQPQRINETLIEKYSSSVEELMTQFDKFKTKRAYQYEINVDANRCIENYLTKCQKILRKMTKTHQCSASDLSNLDYMLLRSKNLITQLSSRTLDKALRQAEIKEERIRRKRA